MKEENNELGFVELVDHMGNAVSIVNSARVSFGKKHEGELREQDKRLITHLWRNKHTSPFRHVYFKFHIKAPIFVLRQWMKHQVGCSWNEISGRYVKFAPSFYQPSLFRSTPPKSIKQGSGGPLNPSDQLKAQEIYIKSINQSYEAYEELLELGVCREQARMLLPLSLFSECYWTASLHALIHFLNLRLAKDAQSEIRMYAEAVKQILEKQDGMKFVLGVCLNEL